MKESSFPLYDPDDRLGDVPIGLLWFGHTEAAKLPLIEPSR